MDNRDFRWIAGILLLAVFGVLAYGGGATTKAQTTQNVLVTNTSAQQVPVLPAARPGPDGAYIVAVNNAPSVKVLSSATAPVVTKDINNPDVNGAIYSGAATLPAVDSGIGTAQIHLSSLPVVIDEITMDGQSGTPGECIDNGYIAVFDSSAVQKGAFYFTIPTVQNGTQECDYLGTVHIPVPANGLIAVFMNRHGGVTGSCYVSYSIAYHTVPHP